MKINQCTKICFYISKWWHKGKISPKYPSLNQSTLINFIISHKQVLICEVFCKWCDIIYFMMSTDFYETNFKRKDRLFRGRRLFCPFHWIVLATILYICKVLRYILMQFGINTSIGKIMFSKLLCWKYEAFLRYKQALSSLMFSKCLMKT